MTEISFEIKGMHCNSCKMLIEDAIEELGLDIKSFDLDLDNNIGIICIKGEIESKEIISCIKKEGDYKVKILE